MNLAMLLFSVTVCVLSVQLLIEWGADVHIKNKVSKTALDLIRNKDLETFLRSKQQLQYNYVASINHYVYR